jgi:hypothetical protein
MAKEFQQWFNTMGLLFECFTTDKLLPFYCKYLSSAVSYNISHLSHIRGTTRFWLTINNVDDENAW